MTESAGTEKSVDGFPIEFDNSNIIHGLKILRIIWAFACSAIAIALDALVVSVNIKNVFAPNVLFGLLIPWIFAYFLAFIVFRFNRSPKKLTLDADGVHLRSDAERFDYPWAQIDSLKLRAKDNVTGRGTSMTTHQIKIIRAGSIYTDDNTGIIDDEFNVPIAEIQQKIECGLKAFGP